MQVSPLKLKRKKTLDDSVCHKAYKLLKQASTKKDECGIYGDYVAEKLRKMNDFYRVQAQHKISNALFELEMEIYRNQGDVQPQPSTSQESQTTCTSNLKCEIILPDLDD